MAWAGKKRKQLSPTTQAKHINGPASPFASPSHFSLKAHLKAWKRVKTTFHKIDTKIGIFGMYRLLGNFRGGSEPGIHMLLRWGNRLHT